MYPQLFYNRARELFGFSFGVSRKHNELFGALQLQFIKTEPKAKRTRISLHRGVLLFFFSSVVNFSLHQIRENRSYSNPFFSRLDMQQATFPWSLSAGLFPFTDGKICRFLLQDDYEPSFSPYGTQQGFTVLAYVDLE